jgi:hypothetical protein
VKRAVPGFGRAPRVASMFHNCQGKQHYPLESDISASFGQCKTLISVSDSAKLPRIN